MGALTVTTHARGNFLSAPVPPYKTYQRMLLRARGQCKGPVQVLLCDGASVCVLRGMDKLLPLSFSKGCLG